MKIIPIILFLFTFQLSSAQNDAFKEFKIESIYLKGSKYIKNDVSYPIGFFHSNLGKEMQISPHAIAEWKKFKTNRNVSLILATAGLGAFIAGINAADNSTAQNTLIISGAALSFSSLFFSINANNQLNKSIWTRNRDLLSN